MILSDALIIPISQLQTEQVKASQLGQTEYLIHLLYSCANFVVEIDKKNLALIAGLNAI